MRYRVQDNKQFFDKEVGRVHEAFLPSDPVLAYMAFALQAIYNIARSQCEFPPRDWLLSIRVRDMPLSNRTLAALRQVGFAHCDDENPTLRALLRVQRSEVAAVRGIGRKTMRELEGALERLGLALGMLAGGDEG